MISQAFFVLYFDMRFFFLMQYSLSSDAGVHETPHLKQPEKINFVSNAAHVWYQKLPDEVGLEMRDLLYHVQLLIAFR
jgi:hypothetical protein